jgi:hypothetical protein
MTASSVDATTVQLNSETRLLRGAHGVADVEPTLPSSWQTTRRGLVSSGIVVGTGGVNHVIEQSYSDEDVIDLRVKSAVL